MLPITTSLPDIKRAYRVQQWTYQRLGKRLGGIRWWGCSPLSFEKIYDLMGFSAALVCLSAIDRTYFPLLRHLAVDFATFNTRDDRPFAKSALKVARRNAMGLASSAQLHEAYEALGGAPYSKIMVSAARAACERHPGEACKFAAWWATSDVKNDRLREAHERACMRLVFAYMERGARPPRSIGLLRRFIRQEVALARTKSQ